MKKENSKFIDLGSRGRLNKKNKLNDLTGKEWLKFTKSWFILRPPRRKEEELLHPAKFPETLVEDFVSFFTKLNDVVFDPFMGTGSTLIAASELGRKCIGIELNKNYFKSASRRISRRGLKRLAFPFKGNSLNTKKIFAENGFEKIKIDYTFTSPPYWNQLERNSIRQKERKQKGFDTKYSERNDDLGNIKSYEEFIEQQALVFDEVYDITKPNGYLTIVTNNVYFEGRLYPLAFDTATSLTRRGEKSWVLKDEKIWLQDDKKLIALGVNNAWVGNRHHQYCLIFRKEK